MRPLLVFLSLLVTCVTSASLLGDKKCAWGPSYWCSHVKHAKECGAFQHCLDTVWKNSIIKSKTTEECTYCQLLVSELRDQLHNKATQEKIASVLSNVCDFLTNPDYKDQCKGIVTEYLPELIEMVDNDLTTNMICATVGFCSGLEDRYSPYGVSTFRNDRAGNSTCTDCMKFFKDVQDSVTSNETEAELEQLLNQTVCSKLEALADTCNEVIKEVLPQALEFLADQIDPDIVCRVFGFCSSNSKVGFDVIHLKKNVFERKSQTALKYQSAEECEICKDLVGQVDEMIRDKTTQDKVKQFLEDEGCSKFGSYAAQCKQLVEEYLPLLFQLLVNELDPDTLCETVRMCPTPTLFKISPKFIAAKLVKPANPGYVKSDIKCTACEAIVQGIDNLLRENQTVALVESILDKICVDLPTAYLAKMCKTYVEKYTKFALHLITTELDPEFVCSKIGLCMPKSRLAIATIVEQDTGLCDVCMFAIGEIEKLLQNVSQDAIMNDLNKVCKFLPPSLSTKCLTYVKDFAPLVIQLLKSKEDPKSLCTLATVCTSSKVKSHKPYMTVPIPEDPVASKYKVSAGPSVSCEVCDTVLLIVKELVGQNSTKEEIKVLLDKACDKVPELFKSECVVLVKQYGEAIVNMLVNHLEPHKICMAIHLCKETVDTNMFLSPVNTLPLQQPTDNEKVASKPKVSAGPSFPCEVCDTVLMVVKELVRQNSTKEEIKVLLDKVCDEVPELFKSECVVLVKQYGEAIVNMLVNHLEPHKICMAIHLCKETVDTNMFLSPVNTLPLQQPTDNEKDVNTENIVVCAACKEVMKFIEKKLQGNKTKANIEHVLETVCNKIPKIIRSECNHLVKTYTKRLIDLFVLSVNPTEICQKLDLCPKNKDRTLPKPVHVQLLKDSHATTGAGCVVCEFIMKELDNILSNNESEAEIQAALKKVCSLLPSTISKECDGFVNKYGPIIISLLVNDLKPSEICAAIGVCASKQFEGLKTLVNIIPDMKAGAEECKLCKAVVSYIKTNIGDNVTVQEVEKLFEQVCSIFPDTVTAQCNAAVKEKVPEIIKLLKQNMDVAKICQIIGFCNTTMVNRGPERVVSKHDDNSLYFQPYKPLKPTKHMLGADKCTYGPSFWCASRENAKNCNAVEHCKVHVWND